jgi:hypothetical protein
VSRRRHGLGSRALMGGLSLLSLYALVERREAYQPRPDPTPLGAVVEGQRAVTLYVVGIDAATLDALLPLAEQGRLPFLATVLREGSYSRLRSITPTRAQPLWMTLATGKYPHRHGIHGNHVSPAPHLGRGAELRLLPVGIGFSRWGRFGSDSRPVDRSERRAMTLWEILARLGATPGVVGWPQAAPPPAGVAFALSEAFFAGQPGHVAPPELEPRALEFRLAAEQIDPAALAPFGLPPPAPVIAAFGQDLWRQRLAASLLDQEPSVRALFLRLPGLRQVSRHWFGGYVAHELEGVNTERAALAARRVEAYYRHLDGVLEAFWTRPTPGPRLLAVVSPYGAAPPGAWRRARSLGLLPVEGVLTGRADGVLLLRGEGVRAGGFVGDAAIEDVVPTLLYALGLPVARDMDGRALTSAYEPAFLAAHPLSFVPSYEALTR